ncbi:MAG: metal-sensing transcriptional repressor [Cellulosilyticum sp.]|nr:metal-sensing transcriptional repressor [Cellulosilyticum sp.]
MPDKISTHQHVLEDGIMIEHTHVQEHTHDDEVNHGHIHRGHTHTHQNTKAVLNRLSKVIGHLESIKRMVENGRDCSEVLVQLAAAKSAINSTGKVILKDHIEHCIVDAVQEQDMGALEELNKAIDRFMK